jgi:hypothetical protein
MKIRTHSESHIVELDDGSRWQIFPGDLDVTLGWQPETDLDLVRTDQDIGVRPDFHSSPHSMRCRSR